MHTNSSYQWSCDSYREAAKPADDPLELKALLEQMVARVFGIDLKLMRHWSRGRARVAMARQVAMYLAHVICGLNLTDAGMLFGRDRTTAAHACRVVERKREDHPEFDRALQLLETIIKVLVYAPAR